MIHGWSAFGGPTMAGTKSKWEDELGRWLKPFLDRLGHKARRRMCPLYIAGLIGPGDRKSVQPMAARLAPGEYDQLHHFIADGVWDAAPLESELLIQADRLVGGKDAVLVIDSRCSLRLCAGGCRLRPQRAVPPGANDTWRCLGRWHPSSSQGVPGRRQADLASCDSGPSPQAAHSGYTVDAGRRHARRCQVANPELAKRDQGKAGSSLRGCSCADRRWTSAAHQGQGPAAPSRRR